MRYVIYGRLNPIGIWFCGVRRVDRSVVDMLLQGTASIVVTTDKLSILFTVIFAYVILREKLSPKAIVGLLLLVAGTLFLRFTL